MNYETIIEEDGPFTIKVHTCNNMNWLYAFPPEVGVEYVEEEEGHDFPWGKTIYVFDCSILEERYMKVE